MNLQSGSVVINMDIPWNPAVLEQRIGRVHRLGQKKTVRIINFVSSSSIEERILELLKFKKSLFAGALDKDWENIVMVGESQLKKFMQSVETMTENLEKTDQDLDRQKQMEAELDEKGAEIKELIEEKTESGVAGKGDGKAVNNLSALLSAGAQFLTNLGKIISDPETADDRPLEKDLSNLINRDEKTGRICLTIPLPEPEVLKDLFSVLGEVMSKTFMRPK